MRPRNAFYAVLAVLLAALLPITAFADSTGTASSNNRFYYSETVSAGDNGYTQAERIHRDDPHFGWSLGRFVISGFTSRIDGDTPVFLKNAGDLLTLSFILDQDINMLNGDESITIHRDDDGYDEYFGVPRQDFGRGTLIIRQTDYQNTSSAPQVYSDYLSGITAGAETTVDLFEEGDYEVVLDYEIESPWIIPFVGFAHNYTHYRIFFRFKVRNSNAMAFLFDTETGNELYNGMFTPNGFRIDTAGSHYLTINVQRKVMNDTGDDVVEDTRFNRSSTDGAVYTDDGIYVVTIKNTATGESTQKTVYVGNDAVMKASVANQMDVSEVQEQLEQGAIIAEDGTLLFPAVDTEASEEQVTNTEASEKSASNSETPPTSVSDEAASDCSVSDTNSSGNDFSCYAGPAAIAVGAAGLGAFGLSRRKKDNGQ